MAKPLPSPGAVFAAACALFYLPKSKRDPEAVPPRGPILGPFSKSKPHQCSRAFFRAVGSRRAEAKLLGYILVTLDYRRGFKSKSPGGGRHSTKTQKITTHPGHKPWQSLPHPLREKSLLRLVPFFICASLCGTANWPSPDRCNRH